MSPDAIADHVSAILARLAIDAEFCKSIGARNGMSMPELIDRAIRATPAPGEAD